MSGNGKLRDILTAALAFVLSRRKETGGFGATPRLPATIQDTYRVRCILALASRHGVFDSLEIEPATGVQLQSYLDP